MLCASHFSHFFLIVTKLFLMIFRYCECFASGFYCDNCHCVSCQNNVVNEAARMEAVGATLDRNPDAFRPKIANSPIGSHGGGVSIPIPSRF